MMHFFDRLLPLCVVSAVAILFLSCGDGGGSAAGGGGGSGGSATTTLGLLGQTTATGVGSGASATTMNTPSFVASDGTRMVVADTLNNRVLIWNTIPTSNGKAADLQLSQTGFTGGAVALSAPYGVAIFNNKLIVADTTNNRVLIWNTFPTLNTSPPDAVIGQTNFTNGGANQGGAVGANTLSAPGGVAVSGTGELYIGDTANSRVLYFAAIPGAASTNASAANVVGQVNTSAAGTGVTTAKMNNPYGVGVANGRLAVVDNGNSRVLIFNTPIADGDSAAKTLGSGVAGCSGTQFNNPYGMYLKANKLYVADASNNRVLFWSDISTAVNGQAADQVVGQSGLTTCTANTGGVGQTSLNFPMGVFSDTSGNLWVGDASNNRVTINASF